MKHHIFTKGLAAAAFFLCVSCFIRPFPDALASGGSYMLEIRTDLSTGTRSAVDFTFYGTQRVGAETVVGSVKTDSGILDGGSSVSVPVNITGGFTEITRMDIRAESGSNDDWKPVSVRLIRCDSPPVSYTASYGFKSDYSYSGQKVCEYMNTGNYTFRSSETVAVKKNPANSAEQQNKLSPLGSASSTSVSHTPSWLVVTIDTADETDAGLRPEGLANLSAYNKVRDNNSRDLQFTLNYKDSEGMPRTMTYYPMSYVYFTSQYLEKHPGATPNPADGDFQKYIASPAAFDTKFNGRDVMDNSDSSKNFNYDKTDVSKACNYIRYQTAYYKYAWFSDGSSDSFIIPVPSYGDATGFKLTNSGIEDPQWKVTGLSLHSLSSYSAAYSDTYMHIMQTFSEDPICSANLGAGVTIVPTGSHSGSFVKGGQKKGLLTDTYMVTIETDNVSAQNGTDGKLSMELTYLNTEGLKKSVTVDVNKEVTAFLCAPSQPILRPGGKDSFPIQLAGVSSILNASFTLSAPPGKPFDDWQMKSVTVTKVDSIDKRHAVDPQSGKFNSACLRRISQVPTYFGIHDIKLKNQKNKVIATFGYSNYDELYKAMCVNSPLPNIFRYYRIEFHDPDNKRLIPPPITWARSFTGESAADYAKPLFLQQNTPSGKIQFTDYQNPGSTGNLGEDKPLESIPGSMDFEQVSGNLQLAAAKCSYTVNVHVADVADAGSVNNFFFQLVFANGTSGVVLANQQLEGDAFRQGMMSSFQIETNQNYGAVKAVRIYTYNSTASAGSSQEFDKLDIEKIEIIRASTQGISSSWTVDNIGWIDIGYSEQDVEGSSTHMLEAKNTAASSSVCKEYSVTSLKTSMDFMVILKTGELPDDGTGNGIVGNLTYIDTTGAYRVYTMKMDELIHIYNNNSSYAFRAGTYDRFRFSLTDVKEIVSLQMVLGGSDSWTCDSVEVYRVSNVGPVYVSANGEYIRDCDMDFITRSTGEPLTLTGSQNTATAVFDTNQNMDVTFTVDENDDIIFNTETTRPPSQDETLNFYVFPSAQYGKVLNSPLQITCKYTTIYGGAYMQISDSIPKGQYLENGAMYLRDVPVTNLDSINGVALSTSNADTPGISHVLIERVNKGKLVDTYYVDFGGTYLTNPFYGAVDINNSGGSMEQKVTFSLPASDDIVRLSSSNDVGVSLRYESAVDPDVVLETPYMYLTKQQISTLSSGDLTTVVLQQPYVGRITGISFATNGGQDFSVENVCITNTDAYGQLLSMSGSGEGFTVEKVPEENAAYIDVSTPEKGELYAGITAPVSITFVTADTLGAGTAGPIEAEIICGASDAPPSDYAMGSMAQDPTAGNGDEEGDNAEEEENENGEEEDFGFDINAETIDSTMDTTTVHIPDLMKYVSKSGEAAAFTQNSKTTVNLLLYDVGTILEIRLRVGINDPWQVTSVTVSRTLADGTVETGVGAPSDWIDNAKAAPVNVRIPQLRDEIAEAKAAQAQKAKDEAAKGGGSGNSHRGDNGSGGSGSGSGGSGGGSGGSGGSGGGSGGSGGGSGGSGSSSSGSGSGSGGSGGGSGSGSGDSGGSGSGSGGSGGSGSGSGGSGNGSGGSGGGSGGSGSSSGDSGSGSGGSGSGSGGSGGGSGGSGGGSGGSGSGSGGSGSGSGGGSGGSGSSSDGSGSNSGGSGSGSGNNSGGSGGSGSSSSSGNGSGGSGSGSSGSSSSGGSGGSGSNSDSSGD